MKVKIENLDNFGRGIAYCEGKIIFIKNALIDEEVEISITKENKKFLEGEVVKYYKRAKNRIKPLCPYYDVCGGCNLEHISLEDENEFKEKKVEAILKKFANVNTQIEAIKSKDAYFYRNKITLHVKDKRLGFYTNNTNELIEIDSCYLANSKINFLIKYLKEVVKQNNIKEIMIRTSNDEEKVLVKLKGEVNKYLNLLKLVDVLIINDKIITPSSFIITEINSKKYQLSGSSFFQINKELTKDLYDEVLKIVKNNSYKKVLDLYCGTGSIGLYISDYVDEVVGIDCEESNIYDANENRLLNNITKAKFVWAKVEDVIDKYLNADLVIVDPPRAGLKEKTIDTIIKIRPSKVIYISCDVVTLARDLRLLKESYSIDEVKPFNMFPRTYHVECLCVLNLK